MYIIGICGYPSSGKSTLAKQINTCAFQKNQSSYIIELDCVLDDLKRALFSSKIKQIPWGEENHITLKSNPVTTSKSQFIIKGYFFIKSIALNILVHKKIFELKKKNYSLIILEGVDLNCLKIPIDYRIRVSCDLVNRINRKSIRERKIITLEDIERVDRHYELTNNEKNIIYDEKIENSSSIENLKQKAVKIYKKQLSVHTN